MTETSYTAKDITVLEGLEPVRLRPGMYIGSTGARGLHHLVYEVVDNSVDEALAGRNERIEVTLHPGESVTVRDFGSGIPVDIMAEQGRPALEVVLTKLHAGGKFGGDGYKVSGGLHGVGVSVVNALSETLVAEVRRDGKVYRQEFVRGVPVADMEIVGEAAKDDTGTCISFTPDTEIFDETEFSAQTLTQRFRETAFLTRGLRIVFVDERQAEERQEFYAEGGIRDFVSYVNEAKDTVHKHVVYLEGSSTTEPSRSRCSGTRRTSSRCSRSRTTSTRTRAARTSPASRRRSPARSTSTPATRASSRRRTRTSRARTSARASPRSSR